MKWGMRFQPLKCNIMQLTNKQTKQNNAEYTLEGAVLQNVDKIKYLEVTITEDLRWNTHVTIFAQRLTEPLVSLCEIYIPVPKM